ncbi:MAG: hypothetical protein WA803_08110 [Steroidobacteraceae bacterium]
MATPADQRLLELLGKWQKSLELHARYSSLDDDSYWKIQPWVEHQRPSRWIIDVAMQKTLALRTQIEERVKMGDAKYSDSLELMIFLANLVGSEHIERFIPVAYAENEVPLTAAPAEAKAGGPAQTTGSTTTVAVAAVGTGATATREMPKFLATKRTPPPAGTAQVARTERKAPAPAKPAAKPPGRQPPRLGTAAKPAPPPRALPKASAKAAPGDLGAPSEAAREQVIADAARLVQWGRKWYELPELIARMADRPLLPEVRRILKENKSAIDAKAGASKR